MIGYTGQVFKIIKLKARQCSQLLYSIHTIQGGLLIDNNKRGPLVILSSKYMVKDHSKRQCFSYNDVLNYLLANEMCTIISRKGTQYLMNVRQKTHTRNHIAPLKLFRENWEKKAENSKHYLRNLTRHNNKCNISNTVVYVSQWNCPEGTYLPMFKYHMTVLYLSSCSVYFQCTFNVRSMYS